MNDIHEFSPEGRGHRILRLLTPASMQRHQVIRDARDDKAPYVLGALQRFGLIDYENGFYSVTPFGSVALESLDAGNPVHIRDVKPGARIFRRDEAA